MIVMLRNLKQDGEELAETFSCAKCKAGRNIRKRLLAWLFQSTKKLVPASERTEATEVSLVLCTVLLLNARM